MNISITPKVSWEGQRAGGKRVLGGGTGKCKGPVAGTNLVAPGAERRPVGNVTGDKVRGAGAPPGALFGRAEKLGSESEHSSDC